MEQENKNSAEDAGGSVNAQHIIDSMDPDEVAAGCFEFRLRARSFDLHQLAHGSKLKKFGRLFRAPSEGGVKEKNSSASLPSSPHHSPPRRRRFVRVVRDKAEDCTEDGRFVVHKYSEAFLKQQNRERHVSESEYGDRPLPYEVTGHTILKRTALNNCPSVISNNSMTGDGESTPPVFKHASFRDEVVVIEFDKKCKVRESSETHVVPLHDAIIDDYDSHAACQRFEDFALKQTIEALTKGLLTSDDTDESEGTQAAENFSDPDDDEMAEESVTVVSDDE